MCMCACVQGFTWGGGVGGSIHLPLSKLKVSSSYWSINAYKRGSKCAYPVNVFFVPCTKNHLKIIESSQVIIRHYQACDFL